MTQQKVAVPSPYNSHVSRAPHSSRTDPTQPKRPTNSISMTPNPADYKLPPIETICPSCKRKQVREPDLLDGSGTSRDLKKPRLEAKPEEINNDEPLVYPEIAPAKECKEGNQVMGNQSDESRESAEDELQRIRKEWTSPIYAFFKSSPIIHYVGSRRVHVFECLAENCKAKGKHPRFVNRYLDKADARSTSNLRKHVKICWGAEIVAAADKIKDLDAIRTVIEKTDLKDGSLAAAFEGMGKGKLTYILSLPTKDNEPS